MFKLLQTLSTRVIPCIKCESIWPSTVYVLTIPNSFINIDDYVQCAPMDSNYMFDELYNLISGFKQKEIRSVLLAILDIKKDKLLSFYFN